MIQQQHLQRVMDGAPVITYGGAGSTVLIWGLHLSDWAAIVSMIIAVCGFGLQIYVALLRKSETNV